MFIYHYWGKQACSFSTEKVSEVKNLDEGVQQKEGEK